MKSKLVAICTVLVLAITLISCGSGGGGDDPADKITITYNENYDGGLTYVVVIDSGTTPATPVEPSRPGWKFVSWCKNEACTEEYTFTQALTQDTTLYALWDNSVTLGENSPESAYTMEALSEKLFGEVTNLEYSYFELDGYIIAIIDSYDPTRKPVNLYTVKLFYPEAIDETIWGNHYVGQGVKMHYQDVNIGITKADGAMQIAIQRDPDTEAIVDLYGEYYITYDGNKTMKGEHEMDYMTALGFGKFCIRSYGENALTLETYGKMKGGVYKKMAQKPDYM